MGPNQNGKLQPPMEDNLKILILIKSEISQQPRFSSYRNVLGVPNPKFEINVNEYITQWKIISNIKSGIFQHNSCGKFIGNPRGNPSRNLECGSAQPSLFLFSLSFRRVTFLPKGVIVGF
jgi:hypothetical protein